MIRRLPRSTLFPYTTPSDLVIDEKHGLFTNFDSVNGLRPVGSPTLPRLDRKSTRLNSSHRCISYAVFCLKKKNIPTGYMHFNKYTGREILMDVIVEAR